MPSRYSHLSAANESLNSSKQILAFEDDLKAIDFPLMITFVILTAIGLVMIYSATIGMSGSYSGSYYIKRQLIALSISSFFVIMLMQLPNETLRLFSRYLVIFSIFLLLMVFMPIIGKEVNNASRWIGYGGYNFQPGELAKIAIILYIADYIARRPNAIRNGVIAQFPIIVVITIVGLILILQRDHGTLMILGVVIFSMMIIGGLKWWVTISIFTIAGLSVSIYIKYFAPIYLIKRLTSFIDPLKDPTNTGYQLLHSLIAYGRGQISGVGIGESIEKLKYLPEIHNDFIMALIAEELGLIGVILVIILFTFVITRGFMISKMAISRNDLFGAMAVYGIILWIGLQAFINIAVTMSLFPTKGITLPFISYGSSSLIVLGIGVGVLFNIQRQKEVLNPLAREIDQNLTNRNIKGKLYSRLR